MKVKLHDTGLHCNENMRNLLCRNFPNHEIAGFTAITVLILHINYITKNKQLLFAHSVLLINTNLKSSYIASYLKIAQKYIARHVLILRDTLLFLKKHSRIARFAKPATSTLH